MKIAGITLAGVGLLVLAVAVTDHAFARPKGAHMAHEHLVVLNDRTVRNGLLQRSQPKLEAADRALDDSVGGKNTAPPTENTTTAAPTSAATTATGMIMWATHPEYCFDISGGRQESGTNVQIWHCNVSNEDHRQFTMPIHGEGPVHWTAHPEDCIDVAGGKTHNGNNVQMWLNDCSHDNMQFVMPAGGRGPLRWAAHPDKCIDIHDGKTGDATNIKLWNCEDNGEHPNQQFLLPFAPA